MAGLAGKTIEYGYRNGDRYRVSFEDKAATWTALAGPAAGSTGTEKYDWAEVASNIYFVTWLEDSGEVVSYVADLGKRTIVCSYVFDKDLHFLTGEITKVGG